MNRLPGPVAAIVACLVVFPTAGTAQPANPNPAAVPTAHARGRALALQYCSSCHLFPEPELLTKSAWVHHIQPEMAKWLGIEHFDYEGSPDGRLLEEAKLFPSSPILSEEDWFAIWDYYRAAAPSRVAPQAAKAPVRTGLSQFRVRKLNPHTGAPMTSLVKIVPNEKKLYVGDAYSGGLFALNPAGEVVERARLGSAPISLTVRPSGTYVGLIGKFFPSDALEGYVVTMGREGEEWKPHPALENLRRPVDVVVADLDQDGRDDLLVCSYGNRLGRFSWFRRDERSRYEERVLFERPGAVHAEVRDLNRDGRPDIVVMTAQAQEGIYLFLNQGRGRFAQETVTEKPPTWGFVGFEIIDFNKDGHLDLLVANGDNGDFALPLKNYHGIRVYLNDGKNHFAETFFYPMHGAYKAVARDFDGDGDLDIAAIAFYPDYGQQHPESFVYLENKGTLKFEASTCDESDAGRWLVMDAGDLDGDGDIDLVLGSFVRGPTTLPIPSATRDRWRKDGAATLLLENTNK